MPHVRTNARARTIAVASVISILEDDNVDLVELFDPVLRGGRRNVRSAYVMGKLGIPIMQIWNQTVPFWDFHR